MTEYEKKIAELKDKRDKMVTEQKEALYARDAARHHAVTLQIVELDKEFTKLLGGIQCPIK